ncbi:MipA/OmpV family protein [Pseudoalteromonas sp. JBTF-M23]|uniref:MipA/OmpV family protein n=1 Tax=Pseudoalteromonas caenipelagi TaxID=2726988 RepID=A0A849VI18_9GAMM|nr:MipA/OmpV family protein [Pseudoalteromonas caenipelagi]NOU52460.1 MipA/OmpV family protein [Pseudoalteromonas caenipelagi]
MNNIKIILITLLLCIPVRSYAQTEPESSDELYWQLSIGAYWVDLSLPELKGADSDFGGLNILADARVEYKNFYLRVKSGDFFGGADIGYQVWNDELQGVDVIYGHYQMGFSQQGYDEDGTIVPELAGIKERHQDQSFGLAYYRTFGQYEAAFELVYDAFGASDGWVLHAEATRSFELRNWDLWVNFGANYYSGNFIDYFYGVDSDEQSPHLPAYEVNGASSVFVQTQANYPIAVDWVFSTGASVLIGSSNVLESPLVESRYATAVFAGVKYVF